MSIFLMPKTPFKKVTTLVRTVLCIRTYSESDPIHYDFVDWGKRRENAHHYTCDLPSKTCIKEAFRFLARTPWQGNTSEFVGHIRQFSVFRLGRYTQTFCKDHFTNEDKVHASEPLYNDEVVVFGKLLTFGKLFDAIGKDKTRRALTKNMLFVLKEAGIETRGLEARDLRQLPIIKARTGDFVIPDKNYRVISPSTGNAIWMLNGYVENSNKRGRQVLADQTFVVERGEKRGVYRGVHRRIGKRGCNHVSNLPSDDPF